MSLSRRFALFLAVTCTLTAIVTTAAWLVVNDHVGPYEARLVTPY